MTKEEAFDKWVGLLHMTGYPRNQLGAFYAAWAIQQKKIDVLEAHITNLNQEIEDLHFGESDE